MATINTPQLTNTNISDTYLGVLHARGVPLSASGQTKIHDGSGEISALALGRQNNGLSVTGLLSGNAIIKGNSLVANELTMPRIDTLNNSDIVIRSGSGTLALSGFSNVFNSVFSSYPDGVYVNPKITVANGLITNIESSPSVVMLSASNILYQYSNSPSIFDYLNTIGDNQTRQIGNSPLTINWRLSNTVTPPPRYAIVNVQIFVQSNGADYAIECVLDGKRIGYGQVREHRGYLGVDTVQNDNQQFIILPVNTLTNTLNNSILNVNLTRLPGTTANGLVSGLNYSIITISLDGWVY
jgi:hypothetical protein